MKHLFLFLAMAFQLSSCATLTNSHFYDAHISSNNPSAKVQIYDSIYNLPAVVTLERSKDDLKIKLITDSTTQDYDVLSSFNPKFLYGNLIWTGVSPIAYFIDSYSSKKYYYGKFIHLDESDTIAISPSCFRDYYAVTCPVEKGQINFVFGLPWVNSFFLKPQYESPKSNTGFVGASVGLEKYYQNNKYIAISASAVTDFFAPIGAVDIEGEWESMNSIYLSLTDNFKFRRFSIGYGANCSMNIWQLRNDNGPNPDIPYREPVTRTGYSLGGSINAYHQVSERLFIGVIYRPTFLNIYPKLHLKYEHLISLDFAFKRRIN